MTNFEAIQASVIYPVEDAKLNKVLFDRDLNPSELYSKENKRAVDLATADLYVSMIATPQITEGGYQISLTDKSNLMKVASAVYLKYGEKDPFAEIKPSVTGFNPW
jgi:hypothetical protein